MGKMDSEMERRSEDGDAEDGDCDGGERKGRKISFAEEVFRQVMNEAMEPRIREEIFDSFRNDCLRRLTKATRVPTQWKGAWSRAVSLRNAVR